MGKKAYLAKTTEQYKALGLKKEIELWEDSVRTTGVKGEYEWWYFDGKMEDGSSLVIVYYTAPITADTDGFAPSVNFALTKPDGTELKEDIKMSPEKCYFDKICCNVKIGESTVSGDLKTYKLHFAGEKIKADVTLESTTPSWRPETGYFCFGDKDYFAWFPSIPEGKMEAVITVNGETVTLSGTGYHDHNWGNKAMFWLMHHWYWGRAKIGEYQVISSYITARKKYGYEHFKVFLLAKNGVHIGDNPDALTYSQSDPVFDATVNKNLHATIVYDYNDGNQHYRITYRMKDIIERMNVSNVTSGGAGKVTGAMKLAFKLFQLDPSYARVTGTVMLEKIENDKIVEEITAPALWEQMYFGIDEEV